jgi:hypothetical protein
MAPHVHAAEAFLSEEDLPLKADESARNLVYLVTFAAVLPDSASANPASPLRTLEGVSRQDVCNAVRDAVAHPVADLGGRPRREPLEVQKLVVFQEEPRHFHVALRLSAQCRFLPLEKALRDRCGFATHWSTSHAQFWSAVRYGAFATERKPTVDPTPLTWQPGGAQLNVFQEAQQPFNASALKQRREAASAADSGPSKKSKHSFTKLDFTALVISENLRSAAAVVSHVKQRGSVEMQHYAARCQRRLSDLVAEAWEWDGAEAQEQADKETDWELVQRLARKACACPGDGCQWRVAAAEFFQRNHGAVNEAQLAAATASVLQHGPGKTTRVPLLVGPTNAGKSTIFDPVDEVFGAACVFHTPSLGASMPLANLASKRKKFIYLDDFRPVEYAALPLRPAPTLPVPTFLKLLGGQYLEVAVSQSFNNGNADLRWRRGVVMTAKADGLWDRLGQVTAEDVRHMQSRVVQFTAVAQLPSESLRQVSPCATSWARWLCETASAAAAGSVPRNLSAASAAVTQEVECDFF